MNYKSLIHHSLSIASSQQPSTEDEIELLHQFAPIKIPDEFIELIRQATEIEFVSPDCCFRIWGASGCLEMNRAYEVQNHIPKCIAIGDNESGFILVYVEKNASLGLHLISLSNLDIDDSILISGTLNELIHQGKNIHLLT